MRLPQSLAIRSAITRRGLLIGAAAGGGLLVAWGLTPRTFPLPLEPHEDEVAFNAWLRIAHDGIVTVAVPQLEMGQGVTTLLPQVVAMELGADWQRVAVEPAPVSGAYANIPLAAKWAPLWMPVLPALAEGDDPWLARSYAQRRRFTATADGTALAAYEQPAREAASAVRCLLMKAAADRWDVDWTECVAAGGMVTHGAHRASFGELAEDAAGYSPPGDLPLRPLAAEAAGAYPPGATVPFARLDLPGKAAGAINFAGDVRLPGMVFAAIRHGPVARTVKLGKYDPEPANLPGVRLVEGDAWLAAVAPTWWAAEQALGKVAPNFKAGGLVDSQQIDVALDQAVKKAVTHRIATIGDPDPVIADKPSLVARYDVAPALHATLETASATARLRDGRLELWLATQAPEAARAAAAQALGLRPRDVVLYPLAAGGSFDARLESDHAVEAALIAREVGKPVQLTWSRWQEHLAGKPRPAAAAVLWAKTNPDGGEVLAWKARIATPAAAREFGRRLFGALSTADAMARSRGEADAMAVEGALPPYNLAHVSVDHVPVSTGIPAGRLRGNAHGMTAFFTESFIDELARAAGREPLSYRIGMLGNDVRLGECLQRCASLAQWDAGADASGQGLACHRIGEGRIAVIATARRDEAGVRVEKISAVADIGRIVNLDIARQQIEGGLVFGLGLTLGASTGYARGLPIIGRLAGLGLPVLANTPEIAVEFIDSTAPAADPGELGVAAVAPAITNALHSATGLRFRKLPLFAEEV
ncbi:MAG: xanthine dehydrogenase family protein molybdopterin-binding subunit [Sphingomonadales bacterium]|nr:xanthine dehydrogenase family protein molybdopterin-binding subunit [Sphingomonadales bacterium]MBU3992692.1 molybdopterin-dependent oxidoreductase [Alphaproteobacteria bacterium]